MAKESGRATYNLPLEIIDAISTVADIRGITNSSFIEELVRQYVQQHGSKLKTAAEEKKQRQLVLLGKMTSEPDANDIDDFDVPF